LLVGLYRFTQRHDFIRDVEGLESARWQVQVIWGRAAGIDIEARRDGQRWMIEAQGSGSLEAMRVNYVLAILGEVLQRTAPGRPTVERCVCQSLRNLSRYGEASRAVYRKRQPNSGTFSVMAACLSSFFRRPRTTTSTTLLPTSYVCPRHRAGAVRIVVRERAWVRARRAVYALARKAILTHKISV
jgi:hypothetical protein